MIIPDDGCLPQITRKGFAAFNNVMLIKVPEKLKKPGEASFQLATLDRSKKGEKWPADQYVDIVMNTPVSKEMNSAEKSSNTKEDNISNFRNNTRTKGKFPPKKFKQFSKNFFTKDKSREVSRTAPRTVPTDAANLNHHFVQNAFPNSRVPYEGLLGEKPILNSRVPYEGLLGEKPIENVHTFPNRFAYPNRFSSDHQPYGGLHGNLLGEGSSSNHHGNRYGAQIKTASATVPREPLIGNRPYNNDFDSEDPPNNQHNLAILPTPPFNDYPSNPPPFPHFVPNAYNANNYPIDNYNEGPRNGNFEGEIFPFNNPNRAEFMNSNNFSRPPYQDSLETGMNNGFNNNPRNDLPPPPPLFANYNDIPNGNLRNNFNGMNPPCYNQETWDDPNRQNMHYNRNTGNEKRYKFWRGKGANKFSKGNNNRRGNNRYQRKKSS